jgi:hypothetical protein
MLETEPWATGAFHFLGDFVLLPLLHLLEVRWAEKKLAAALIRQAFA